MNATPKQPDQIGPPFVAATPPSTAERLVQALTYDIDVLRASRSQPGWTPWALLAGGGTIAWALATLWARERPVPLEVGRWSIVLYLGITLVRRLRIVLSPSPRHGGRTSRFRVARDVLGSTHLQILLSLVVSLAAIWLVRQVGSTWPFHAATVAVGWFGFEVAVAVLVFMFSAFGGPAPADFRRTIVTLILDALIVATLLYAFGGAAYSVLVVAPASPKVIRPALLLVALLIIGEMLSGEVQDAPLLETFVELRRNLLLGVVAVEAAAREYDIARLGLQASDVLQNRIKRLLAIAEKLTADAAGVTKRLEDTQHLLKAIPQPNAADIDAAERNVEGALKALGEKFHADLTRYQKEYRKLKWRVAFLMGMSADKSAIGASVSDLLKRGLDDWRSEMGRLKERGKALSAEIKAARSALQLPSPGSDTVK